MRISEAKELLAQIVAFNLMEYNAMVEKGLIYSSTATYIVPMFVGDPGLGKTAIPRQIAAELELPFFQTIVAQYDAGEMAGFPMRGERKFPITQDGKKVGEKTVERMVRLRPSYLPDIDDPEQQVGIYNLDELPQAFLANQNICSQLVNEWRIGEHQISRGITICATGNKPDNKAGTTVMPNHLKDRLMMIEIEHNLDDWLAFAAARGIDPRVRTFVRQNPKLLHQFDPKAAGVEGWPTPRSWEKTSTILALNLPKHIRMQSVSAQIGSGAAKTFEQWLRVEDRMPKIEDIIAHPETAPTFENKDADVLYLLLSNLAEIANEKNIDAILKYVTRIQAKEFMFMWYKEALLRHENMMKNNKVVNHWKIKHVGEYVA